MSVGEKEENKSNWFEPSKGIGKKEEAAAVAIKSDSKVLPSLFCKCQPLMRGAQIVDC